MSLHKRYRRLYQWWWTFFTGPRRFLLHMVAAFGLVAIIITSNMGAPHISSTPTQPIEESTGSQGTIYYQERSSWEVDFIFHELLWDIRHWSVHNFSSARALSTVSRPIGGQPVVIIYNDESLFDMHHVIDRFQPSVLIQLSDEDGHSPQHMELAARVPLILRQYRHAHYPGWSNVYQIPLGYISGFLNGTSSTDQLTIKPMPSRTLQWSFVGTLKQDRANMIASFEATLNHSFYVSHKDSPAAIFNAYENSLFVPNGRGNVVLDCFRLYEATLTGAIPVVVGSWSEVREAFYFDGDIPPWIFEETWETAAARCADLSANVEALQQMQEEQLKWWSRQLRTARKRIWRAIIEGSQSQHSIPSPKF